MEGDPFSALLGRDLFLLASLRGDVVPSGPFDEPSVLRFLTWWYNFGLDEYPELAKRLAPELWRGYLQWLTEPAPGIVQDVELPISRYFLGLRELSDALKQGLDLQTQLGRRILLRWAISFGLQEHRRRFLLSSDQLARLQHLIDPKARLPLSALLLWEGVAEVRENFPLSSPEQVFAFSHWYHTEGAVQWAHDLLFEAEKPVLPRQAWSQDIGSSLQQRISLVGFAKGEFGIGEDIRTTAFALEAAGVPFEIFNCHPAAHREQDESADRFIAPEATGDINIFCMSPIDTLEVYLKSPLLFSGRYNVGYWPWELSVWPDQLTPICELVDEIWVATQHICEAFLPRSRAPVIRMPPCVELTGDVPVDHGRFSLPRDCFSFLFVFDWSSFVARKNPLGLVRAFSEAFDATDQSVSLILKTMNSDRASAEFATLLAHADADRRIRIIDETLPRIDVLGLMSACDAVVSLHRAEGFGRTLAEAMLLGKPVIATDWSGNLDFCNGNTAALVPARAVVIREHEYPFSAGLSWAEPDIDEAANLMRKVRTDSPYRAALAQNGQNFVAGRYNREAAGVRYRFRLEAIRRELSSRA